MTVMIMIQRRTPHQGLGGGAYAGAGYAREKREKPVDPLFPPTVAAPTAGVLCQRPR